MILFSDVHPNQPSSTRLVRGRVWMLVSALLVIIFIACAVIAIPELVNHPENVLFRGWTQTQVDSVLLPLGLPITWLIWIHVLLETGFALTAFITAAAIFAHQPKERFSYYVAFWLVLHGGFSGFLPVTAAARVDALVPVTRILLMAGWFGLFLIAYLFPSGRFVPRWTWISLPFFAAVFVLFIPSYVLDEYAPDPILAGTLLVIALGGVLAQGYRFTKVSSEVERRQAKWVWFAIAMRVVYVIAISIPALRDLITNPSILGLVVQTLTAAITYAISAMLPLAVGAAILRHRLWEIEPILNRVLVYSGLTLFVVVSYVLIVGGVGLLVGARSGVPLLSILATGLVAVSFQPLRARLQRGVNRLVYGERDEPYKVLTRLRQRLETAIDPVSALSLTVETIAQALKLPYAAITYEQVDKYLPSIMFGVPDTPLVDFPLIFAGETIGVLHVGQRAPNEPLTDTDYQLIGVLAQQIGAAAHAALLAAELQAARLKIVETREETRRRLGSDLHDGVGHQLVMLARLSEQASALLKVDPDRASIMLKEINQQLNITVSQVRALAHQLHPPELEVLGLEHALREQAQMHPNLTIRFDVPDRLPLLPAAVETAAYYITLESITNIEKHAVATSCLIHLRTSELIPLHSTMLTLEISDNGVGLSEHLSDGLGLLSMQGRAVEVGGTCQVIPNAAGGTMVLVSLPFQSVSLENKRWNSSNY
jgi:signal transduction histidine kinase